MRDYGPVLQGVLSAAASALNDAGVPAARVLLAPGIEPAWDACCDGGGQLYLRLGEVYPSGGDGSAFPSRDTTQRGAGGSMCAIKMLALRLHLGVIRCAHTLDNNGNPPSAENVSADAMSAVDDMALLLDVITCVVPEIRSVMRVTVDRWLPKGVNGGCAGGEWTFLVALDPCLCR